MKISLFLKSKVGRRIVLLFVVCALIPVTILGAISFRQVIGHLRAETERRLYQDCKAFGMSTIERLRFLEAELHMMMKGRHAGIHNQLSQADKITNKRISGKFSSFIAVEDFNAVPADAATVFGSDLAVQQKKHLASGRPLLAVCGDSQQVDYYMAVARIPDDLSRGGIIGKIKRSYLWGRAVTDMLPPLTELCVLGDAGRVLYSTLPIDWMPLMKLHDVRTGGRPVTFEWENSQETYVAAGWTVLLDYMFAAPKWTLVMSMPTAEVYRPVANFKMIFPLALLLSLLVVMLLSLIQIRRSLVPLEKLKDAARNIGRKQFTSRVSIKSADEFEELGESFNTMAENLEKLFNAMSARSEIDRCILSSLHIDTIVSTVLQNSDKFFRSTFVSISVLAPTAASPIKTYRIGDIFNEMCCFEAGALSDGEAQSLLEKKAHFFRPHEQGCPSAFRNLAEPEAELLLIVPVRLAGSLGGLIALGYNDAPADINDDVTQAMHLAEQMAVAFTNANLIQDLSSLSRGTIRALARTVDAKSPWTAGHSERVADLAVEIARELGLPAEEIEKLHRAALLHDIGKIGIPVEILDKRDRLTEPEHEIICKHPEIGARILEPIEAYSDITSIIVQHHEYYDGTGYPMGLSGEHITLSARILAVADVYDAMVSDRPYRSGKSPDSVVRIVRQESGKQFDPEIVDVFLRVFLKTEQVVQYG